MADVIGTPALRAEFDSRALVQGAKDAGVKLRSTFEESNRQVEAQQRRASQRIQGLISQINADKPRRAMFELGQAVQHLGGTASLTEQQLAKVRREVERLTAAGAKAPKSLAGLLPSGPGGAQAVGGAAGQQLQSVLTSRTGALGGVLSAAGPVGIASAAAVGGVVAMASAVKDLAAQAERWSNIAQSTGLGTTQVQQLQALLEDAGIPAESLTTAFKAMQSEIAGGGTKLAEFGLKVSDLRDLTPEEQLRTVAERINAIEDPATRTAAAVAAFGRSGQQLIPVLSDVAAGADKMFQAFDEEEIRKLKQADAAIDTLGRKANRLKGQAAVGILNVIDAGGLGGGLAAAAAARDRAAILPQVKTRTGLGGPATLTVPKGPSAAELEKDRQRAEQRAEADRKAEAAARKLREEEKRLAEEREKFAARIKAGISDRMIEEAANIVLPSDLAKVAPKAKAGGTAAGMVDAFAGSRLPTETVSGMLQEEAEAAKEAEQKTRDLVDTFGTLAQQLTNLSQHVGGLAGKLLGLASSISSGIGGVLAGIQGFEKAGEKKGILGTLGKVASSFGIVGSVVGAVGGIVTGIKGIFQGRRDKKDAAEASKILGQSISKEQIKALKEEAKAQGKDWRDYLRERKAADEKARAVEARQKLEGGLSTARGGAEGLMERLSKGGLSEGLTTALQALISKVGDALLKNGLGILDGRLKESEAFQEAQGTAADIAQVIAGMREAGLIDQGLLAAGGAAAGELSKQATDAALAKGLTPEEAAKAGSAAIVPILREQLNASIQSGKELDETTKQLLEEAKNNGIEVLADPAIESLDVQRRQLGVLERIARNGGGRGGGGDDDTVHAAKGLGPVRMPNLGGGLGPLIQTHAGELALIVPAHMSRKGGLLHAARGLYEDEGRDRGDRDRTGTGGGEATTTPTAAAAAAADALQDSVAEVLEAAASATPIQINAPVTLQIIDESVVKTVEGQRAFGRHVVAEVERALDQNAAGLESRIARIARREVSRAS